MKEYTAIAKIDRFLESTEVTLNGSKPGDILVKREFLIPFCHRIIRNPSLGLGESCMDGWCTFRDNRLDIFIEKISKAGLDEKFKTWRMIFPFLQSYFLNLQTRTGSLKVAKTHYDLSPKMYESFLDPYNQYTCGYYENGAECLNEAQIHKMHLICQKLQLNENDHLLDIGCGWGGFAKFATENYGCKVTGITISEEQAKYARDFNTGLPVVILEMDYRDLLQSSRNAGKFTKVLVCGMVEHVGVKNYRKLMKIIHYCLADGGLFLLQTIAGLKSTTHTDPWLEKYIFPNSHLPSEKQLAKATEGLFKIHDLQNFGPDYDPTLMAWHANFQRNFKSVQSAYYNERFYLMMEFYFLSCAGAFRARKLQEYHIVYSKNLMGKYIPVR